MLLTFYIIHIDHIDVNYGIEEKYK